MKHKTRFDSKSWKEYWRILNIGDWNWSKEDYEPTDILGQPKKNEWAGMYYVWIIYTIIAIPFIVSGMILYAPIKYLSCWRREWKNDK
jgi:hypothetical protein